MNSRSFLPLVVRMTPSLNGGCHPERSEGSAFPLGPDKFLAQITRSHEIVIQRHRKAKSRRDLKKESFLFSLCLGASVVSFGFGFSVPCSLARRPKVRALDHRVFPVTCSLIWLRLCRAAPPSLFGYLGCGAAALCIVLASFGAEPLAQRQSAGLRITDALFEDYSGAPAARWEMKLGEEVALNFRIEGFGRQEAVNKEGLREERVSLHYEIELRDPLGVPVEAVKSGEIVTALSAQDAEWRPKVNWSARVPSSAPGGTYTIHIQVNDRIANRDNERSVPFRVLGPSVPAADGLQVAQLEYSNSERGPWNPERYFSPAETIWVRYKVTGYRVSSEKQVWVEQDWTALDSDGKLVVTQPNAAVANERSFYPPRFLSTAFTLNLKSPKPGKYTLRIAVRDRISEQMISMDSDFFIRP